MIENPKVGDRYVGPDLAMYAVEAVTDDESVNPSAHSLLLSKTHRDGDKPGEWPRTMLDVEFESFVAENGLTLVA